jgi:hypothetical protein
MSFSCAWLPFLSDPGPKNAVTGVDVGVPVLPNGRQHVSPVCLTEYLDQIRQIAGDIGYVNLLADLTLNL